MHIFLLVNELRITCGVSTCVYNFVSEIRNYKDYKVTIVCGGGDGIQRIRELNIEVIESKYFKHENRSRWGFIHAHFLLRKLIKKYKPDIIHSHHHYLGNIARNVSRNSKVKLVFTNHGILPEQGRLNQFPADNIIAVNEHIVEHLNKSGMGNKKINLIRCGVKGYGSFVKPDNVKLKFLAASRLVHDKGLDIYIQAVGQLDADYRSRAEFFIAGKGPSENELVALNDKLNAGVIFLGEINDMKEILTQNDVFVFPSRSVSEGFPLALVEASFARNIIITSPFRGSGSVIDYNKDVVTFENENPEDLKIKIEQVIENYEAYNKTTSSINRKMKALFSCSENASKVVEFYKQVLAS